MSILMAFTLNFGAQASDLSESVNLAKKCFTKHAKTRSGKAIRLSQSKLSRFESTSGKDMALLTSKTRSAHYRGDLSAVFEYSTRGKLVLLEMNVRRGSTYGNVKQNLDVRGPYALKNCR